MSLTTFGQQPRHILKEHISADAWPHRQTPTLVAPLPLPYAAHEDLLAWGARGTTATQRKKHFSTEFSNQRIRASKLYNTGRILPGVRKIWCVSSERSALAETTPATATLSCADNVDPSFFALVGTVCVRIHFKYVVSTIFAIDAHRSSFTTFSFF